MSAEQRLNAHADRIIRTEHALAEVIRTAKQHLDIYAPTLHWRDLCDALVAAEKVLKDNIR